MRIQPLEIPGVAVVEVDLHEDERGHFARTFDRQAFEDAGLETAVEQCNVSFNHRAGTVRGMHLQVGTDTETKLVRCVRGAVLDVVVDLRPHSPTRLQHVAVELSAANRRALFVPALFAHGFQTLKDDTEVFYQISGPHVPDAARGLRHDDPALGITWPLPVSVISDRDQAWPSWSDGDPVAGP